MKNLIILILSWLVHHANREGKNELFYAIKNKVLAKYGKHTGYDVQFIPGKKCHTCHGSGDYYGWQFVDTCNRCGGTGWYKPNEWNMLSNIRLGKYYFHQPFKRVYKDPMVWSGKIEGYIEHTRSKYGRFALLVLYIIYDRKSIKLWFNPIGQGYRLCWWLPRNMFFNTIYFFRHFRRIANKQFTKKQKVTYQYIDHELPF